MIIKMIYVVRLVLSLSAANQTHCFFTLALPWAQKGTFTVVQPQQTGHFRENVSMHLPTLIIFLQHTYVSLTSAWNKKCISLLMVHSATSFVHK